MGFVGIWVWQQGQAALEPVNLGLGHAEMQIGEVSYGLWPDRTREPIDPSPDEETKRVYRGFVRTRHPDRLAQLIEHLRAVRLDLRLPVGEPPEVAVFHVPADDMQLMDLVRFIARLDSDKSLRYCPTAIGGSMNCVTFVTRVLREVGVLDLRTNTYVPQRLYALLEKKHQAGTIPERHKRVLREGKWSLVSGPRTKEPENRGA